jgi:hypothetical protein
MDPVRLRVPLLLSVALAAFPALSGETAPEKITVPGIEFRATRCKTGCAAGKFRFNILLFNNSAEKIRVNKNDLKYKLRISYKPAGAKGGKKAPPQPYKTIAFMQGSGSTEEWTEIDPGDFIGIRKEVELGKFDQGLCGSPAITLYGTLHLIGANSNPELEINQKIAGNCAI